MTLEEAKSIARHLGFTLRKLRSGDYRVNFGDGNETTAYYTDSLEDAVNTAVDMRKTPSRMQSLRSSSSPSACADVQTNGVSNGVSQRPMIAIVDDDELVCDATTSLIESLGYNAVGFSSAEQFLQSGHLHKASCLITDVQMPGLSGLDLQDCLIARGSAMPVIVVGGSLDERDRSRALRAGALGCLSKPYSLECLVKYLEMALKGRNSADAST